MSENKLIEMNRLFPQTELWTDSFHIYDHEYGLANDSKGITSSPTWVGHMICDEKKELHTQRIRELYMEHPALNESELLWEYTLKIAEERSQIMLPLWKKGNPKQGRFSVQTSIYDFNNAEKIIKMAEEVHQCGPNMQVKIPLTKEGLKAIEESTYRGFSVMATLCFSVDQAVAAAKAVERGMKRRESEGLSNEMLNPMCAVLLGMQDDWLKNYAEHHNIALHPDALNWGAVAICKKIYHIFKERNYRTRLLTSYYRHRLHWSEFIGGDIAMTIPVKWQKRFVNSSIPIRNYMDIPVEARHLEELTQLTPFVKAYTENTFTTNDFNTIEPLILTVHYFTETYEKGIKIVRNIMMPPPYFRLQ